MWSKTYFFFGLISSLICIVHLQAGEYVWMTYKEVYDVVMKLAASISKSGISKVINFPDEDYLLKTFAGSNFVFFIKKKRNAFSNI